MCIIDELYVPLLSILNSLACSTTYYTFLNSTNVHVVLQIEVALGHGGKQQLELLKYKL